MKLFFSLLFALTLGQHVAGQTKFFTKSGRISFFSKAPIEDIEAHNAKGVSVFDMATGQLEFSVLMQGFEFEKAKMQEHFNEDYVESDKFPKATFVGTIKNASSIKINQDGVYNTEVAGKLTLHGVTQPQNVQAIITIKNGVMSAVSEMSVALSDYNIKIPALVKDNISKTVKVTVQVSSYQPMASRS